MFAEIVLHRRVPSKFESFTYQIPENLKVELGQIVRVPFKTQKISGIVRRLHEKTPPYPTKSLEIALPIVLAPRQMELAAWMSEHYKCAFSKVIDFFIPEKIWNEPKKKPAEREKPKFLRNQLSFEELNQVLQKFAKKLLEMPCKKLVIEKTLLPRKAFYNYLSASLPQDSQALFLFPEFSHIEQLNLDLPAYHGGLNETQKAAMWESIRTGGTKIIAGTRAALFLPFKNLSAIVLDFEHNESYFEKRQPNYHALNVAEKIAEMWNIPMIVISATPRVETWNRLEASIGWHEENMIGQTKIIDMRNERRRGNFGIFSDAAIENIASALAKNKQVLLFMNRKGEASALLCRDCGNVFRCASCTSALAVHSENQLKCHKCGTTQPMPDACGMCKNSQLKSIGFGTEKLENEIKKIFSKAQVERLDREIAEKGCPCPAKADILIATNIIAKPFDLPRLRLAIAVMPDPQLNFPEFRAGERLFQILTHIRLLCKNGELMIQTFMPEHSLYQNLTQNKIEDFYKNELAARKSLNLPPFNI